MDKSCKTCRQYAYKCSCVNNLCEDWEAKEMERIQMTTEQAWKFIHDMNLDSDGTGNAFFYGIMKNAGYIKKDIVEEAEEMYDALINKNEDISYRELIEKQHEAIQYLKERQK